MRGKGPGGHAKVGDREELQRHRGKNLERSELEVGVGGGVGGLAGVAEEGGDRGEEKEAAEGGPDRDTDSWWSARAPTHLLRNTRCREVGDAEAKGLLARTPAE